MVGLEPGEVGLEAASMIVKKRFVGEEREPKEEKAFLGNNEPALPLIRFIGS
jgi:hypothetical protein